MLFVDAENRDGFKWNGYFPDLKNWGLLVVLMFLLCL